MNEVKNEVKTAEAEEKKIVALTATEKENNEVEDAEDDDLILTFNKPYVFEGKTYTKIDLSPLADMTTADLKAVARYAGKGSSGDLAPEVSLAYAIALASRKCDMPIEFFDGLPACEGMKIKNRVMGFLLGLE